MTEPQKKELTPLEKELAYLRTLPSDSTVSISHILRLLELLAK